EPEYEFIPSGRLVLMVETSWGRGLQKTWADTQKKKLEGRLNAFITGLIRISVKQRAERLERDRWQRECQEAELRRIERQQQRREEERKLNELTNQVDSWHKAERIRAYVEAVRSAAKRTHGQIEVGGELEQWLRWASEQAERI